MSLVRAAILGGLDGVITSFAIVTGIVGGNLKNESVAIVGISSLLADGFSMGVSEYLSSTSEKNITKDTKSRPIYLGLVCFVSFVLFGSVPLIAFILTEKVAPTVAFASVALMILGASKTYFTNENLLFGLFQTLLLGCFAGGVAFFTGMLVNNVIKNS